MGQLYKCIPAQPAVLPEPGMRAAADGDVGGSHEEGEVVFVAWDGRATPGLVLRARHSSHFHRNGRARSKHLRSMMPSPPDAEHPEVITMDAPTSPQVPREPMT